MATLVADSPAVSLSAQALPVTLRHPWRGPAPAPDDPIAAAAISRATARFVGGLFLAVVLCQRFSVPGLPKVALLVPLVMLWCAWGVLRGILRFNRTRLLIWLTAAGLTAAVVMIQQKWVVPAELSVTSWGLFFTVWFPSVFQLIDRRRTTYLAALRLIAYAAAFQAALCVIFMLSQWLGLAYTDYFAQVVPKALQLQGFVITYPVTYDSPIYRSNGWIGLEPSMVSIIMGVGLLAAFFSGVRLWVLLLIVAGMLSATAGSGLAIVLVALIVIMGYPVRRDMQRYLPAAIVALGAIVMTPFGQALLARATESSNDQSSTSLRAITPYSYLWPQWVNDISAVLWGRGPGSSQSEVDDAKVLGLLVPTPAKIFFEYGLLAGLALAVLLWFSYVGGPSRSIPVALAVSLWLLQPGTTTMIVVLPVFVTTTWWSPRVDRVLESDITSFAAARSWWQRAQGWRPLSGVLAWRPGSSRATGRTL